MRILIKTYKWETYVLHRKQHVTTRSSYKTINFYKMFSELKSTGEKTTLINLKKMILIKIL